MAAELPSSSRQALFFAASLVALPAVIFYAILFHFAPNLPFMDDYDAGLNYLNISTQIPTFSGRLLYLLAAQHNEYKIVFGHAVVWLQMAVFGHINFSLTCILGNAFVLLLGWLLWKMFLPRQTDAVKRLALFAPVSLLLFQLNYTETLNWALPCLQNINVLLFAFAAIYFLTKDTRASFACAAGLLVLAISASGNGFLVVPVGLIVLFLARHYARIVIWLAVTVLCLAGYAYHYNSVSSQTDVHHSIFYTILNIRPLYVVAFIGSSAFIPQAASYLLGLVITLTLGYMLRQGYWRRNPLVCYCILFVLLTAIGVAGIRSDLGLLQATSSRYRIYCDFLMIFIWFYVAEELIQHSDIPLRRNRPFVTVLVSCCVFALLMDAWGIRSLNKRDRNLIHGMTLFEHPDPAQPAGPVYPQPNQPPSLYSWDVHARAIMIQSIQLGIYHPPSY